MKLLDNVRMYNYVGGSYPVSFGTETDYHYGDCDKQGYIRKSQTRPLTIDEKVDYLYDLCCQPHSRWDDLTELCKAFPLIQPFLLRNFDHRNRDEIKFKLKFALSYLEMP